MPTTDHTNEPAQAPQEIEADFHHAVERATQNPENADAQFAAGCACVAVGIAAQSVSFFEQAILCAPDSVNAYHNLALAHLQLGNPRDAAKILASATERNVADANMWHDLAVLQRELQDDTSARRSLRRALKLDPAHHLSRRALLEMCRDQGDVRRTRRYLKIWGGQKPELPKEKLKLAVVASNGVFMQDIIASLSATFDIQQYNPRTVGELQNALKECDVAWFEWCDEMLVQATNHLPKLCPVICRLHSYEAFADAPERVNWEKVDHVVFVNESVQALLNGRLPDSIEQSVIPNAVDLKRFALPEDKRYGKRIASVGYINYKKNPQLLLYCFAKIQEWDSECEFHIAGEHQDSRIRLYMEDMSRKLGITLHWHGWVEDMPAFYESMDFVISTSLFESFHYSIAEGMASGLVPLVHHWFGAEHVYPEKWLFRTPDECLTLVKKALAADRRELARESASFISERYSLPQQVDRVKELIEKVNAKPDGEACTLPDYGLVSIIIPTYNRADLLPAAISSAVAQTYENCEIVVVDDGSTDNTRDILAKFKEELGDKLVVIHQENRGVSAALNTAIQHSSGEYISWLSSDDAYHPEKVWENVRLLGTRDDIDWVYSDFYYMTQDSQVTGRAKPDVLTPENIVERMFDGNPIHGCSVMFRKSNLEKTGLFDEELGGKIGYGADGAMWHKMGSHFRFAYIDKPLVYYRLHAGQVTHQADIPKSRVEYRESMEAYFAASAPGKAEPAVHDAPKSITKREWLIDVIKRLMAPCNSILELGAGHFEMIGSMSAPRRTGVEIHRPYIDRRVCDKRVEVIEADALKAKELFAEHSYDGVMLIDFIEHVEKGSALELLDTVERIARTHVLVHCPLGHHPQDEDAFALGGEEFQRHRSEWEPEDFKARGYETLVIEDFFANKPGCDPRAVIALKRMNAIT